jgi:ABC-type Fe3+/spermidine/putrescine transport system ATPase subunit
MREEIRRIQKRLGITTIYVTHDQEEAMAVSDRIAILNRGRLDQVGTPAGIYFRPASRFAAEFMGGSNLLEFSVVGYDAQTAMITAEAAGQKIRIKGEQPAGRTVAVSIRPEWIRLVPPSESEETDVLAGTVQSSTFLGSMVRYRVAGPGGQVLTIEVHHLDEGGICPDGERLLYRIPPDRPVILRG